MEDLKKMAGLEKKVKFGESVQSNIISKLKLADREVKFISILDTDRFSEANVHYLKQTGAFYCWRTIDEDGIIHKGSCCKIMSGLSDDDSESFPSTKFVLPIIIYKTISNSDFDTSNVEYGRLDLTKKDYNKLLREIESEGVDFEKVTNCVIKVSGVQEGQGKYIRVAPEFRIKSEKNPIGTNNVLKKEISDFLIRWDELISNSLAKILNEDKLIKIVDEIKLEEGEITTRETPIPEVRGESELGKVEAEDPVESVDLSSLDDFEDIDLSDIVD